MGSSRWLIGASLIVVVGVFVARISAIVEPLGPDQGVYATIGWAMQHGFALYRDLFEMKPPGLYVTYRMGFALFGTNAHAIFWMDYAAALLTMIAVFDLCRRIVGVRFAALAAAVFALGTWPAARHAYGGFLERTINETFISLFATAAMWAAADRDAARAQGMGGRVRRVHRAGRRLQADGDRVLAGVGGLGLVSDRSSCRTRRFAAYSAAGAVIAPAIALTWMWGTGIMPDAWLALAVYNGAYLTLGDVGVFDLLNRFAHEVFRRMKTDEVWALGTVGALPWPWAPGGGGTRGPRWWPRWACSGWARRSWRSCSTARACSRPISCRRWCRCACSAPGSSTRRSRPHRRWRLATAALVVALIAIMLVRSGSPRRAADVTRADTLQLFGSSERQDYLHRFQSRSTQAFSAADAETLADYLRARTEPNERVFIFGMTASAYFLSGRLPASRFLFVYPAVSNMADRPEFRVETLAAELSRSAPRYIVLQRHNRDSFSGWRADVSFAAPPMAALLQDYRQETEIGDYALYRRN